MLTAMPQGEPAGNINCPLGGPPGCCYKITAMRYTIKLALRVLDQD